MPNFDSSWNVILTFTENLLGSAPKNEEIYRDFIESRKVKRANSVNDSEKVLRGLVGQW